MLITFLIYVLIAVVVLYVLRLALPFFGLPDPANKIVLLIVGLVFLLLILSRVFGIGIP